MRTFPAGMGGPPKRKNLLYAAGGAAVVLILLLLTHGSSAKTERLLEAMDKRMAMLENRVTRNSLDMAGEIQRSLAGSLSNALEKGPQGKAYPPVFHLPADKRKRILVTGGAGFVGSHLVDVLMMQGHHVYVIDNLFTGRRENIEHWLGHPHFHWDQHDVTLPYHVEVDQIYHLACPASPPHYQYNPIKTIKTSVMGTLNMLGLAKRVKARLLFTSTSEIYGDPEVHPQPESYVGHVNVAGPRSCYDEGKRLAETMCYSYQSEEGVEVRISRIFNTFGPRMHPNDGRVVSNFIIQALKGEPMTIYGDGSQTRSFQYVADLVAGLIKLMNSDYNRAVNIGNPDEYTIKEFAGKIRSLVNPAAKIEYLPATQDDPKQRRPDISLAKRVIDWEPRFSVDEGLAYTVSYFAEELGIALPEGAGAQDGQYTRRDAPPLWVASIVNEGLTDKEKGL